MNILEYPNRLLLDEFQPEDLVTWHNHQGNQPLPIAAVVIRRERNSILIKARIQGAIQEVCVSHEELASR